MDKKALLEKHFGYTTFRDGQEDVIDHILAGQDVVCVMPTGAGKSMCYQIPALLFSGITIVISPLISLMQDQVLALVDSGVKAAYLNSSLSFSQYNEALRRMQTGRYKIVYVAPERLMTESFLATVENLPVSMITVDEAHCISQWGQDFRPSYLQIPEFIKHLQKKPVVSAFTATATEKVKIDIAERLKLNEPFQLTTGFNRENLYFEVKTPQDKTKELLRLLRERCDSNGDLEKTGIVYCGTRKNVEMVCERLCLDGFSATMYHAGLPDQERKQNQTDFQFDRKTIMVATNAFGMGIDKSNVSFVIHYNMPMNLESYYQEAGRAGRDGAPADCILLYHAKDVRLNQFLIENSEEDDNSFDMNSSAELSQQRKTRELELLKQMTWYSTTTDCLRNRILRYFGDSAPISCGNCGNCNTHFEEVDISKELRYAAACVSELEKRETPLGKKRVTDILLGKTTESSSYISYEKLEAFGMLSDKTARLVQQLIEYMIQNDYLVQSAGEYPILTVSEELINVCKKKTVITMKIPKERKKPKSKAGEYTTDQELFQHLRQVRAKRAAEEGIPAYMVFSDAVLLEMCKLQPTGEIAMLRISGIGKVKLERYGEIFIEEIKTYVAEHA